MSTDVKDDGIAAVENRRSAFTEMKNAVHQDEETAGHEVRIHHHDDYESGEQKEGRRLSDTTKQDVPLIVLLSFLWFCAAVLGWCVFSYSKIDEPAPHGWSTQTKKVTSYSVVAVDLSRREPQGRALAPLPSSSGTVVSPTSIPTPTSPPSPPSSSLNQTSTLNPPSITSSSTSSATSTSILQVFQLDPPVMGPGQVVLDDGVGDISAGDVSAGANSGGGASCQVTLMEHEFKNSFGQPFVGNYTPPACMGNSNTVVMNFTVRSFGGQFDRLAIMYLGDTEVFRTSTAEPKRSGIAWTYLKDMSHLISLWKAPQKVIFDLPNQTNANITGTYITSLTATFFSASQSINAANIILPLSSKRGITQSIASTFIVPAENATTKLSAGSFPSNAKRAIVSIAATGQGNEEFWWQNALSSAVLTYNASGGVLFGDSPFREVQLWLDGQMAGVVWPFPVIFTGGIVPAFWSPMVGIQAFDLNEGEIDLTPWLGTLCDGKSHTFDMRVVGLSDDAGKTAVLSQGVGGNWVLSGKIFVWTDSNATATTTSDTFQISSSDPEILVTQTITQNATGGNDTLLYTTSVRRTLTISSNVKTEQYPNGRLAVWTQNLTQTTNNSLTSQGNIQANTHVTSGKDYFLMGSETPYAKTYSYPLFANTTVSTPPNVTARIDATIDRSYHSEISGQGAAPSGLQPFANLAGSSRLVATLAGTTLVQSQSGNATLIFGRGSSGGVAGNGSSTFGSLLGTARFGGRNSHGVLGMEKDEELWFRMVNTANGSVREDVQRLNGKGVGASWGNGGGTSNIVALSYVDLGSMRFLGRKLSGGSN